MHESSLSTDYEPGSLTSKPAAIADTRVHGFVEGAPDAIVIAGADGRIVLVNVRAEELFGYPRQELIGQTVEVLLPERFRDSHVEHRTGFMAAPRTRLMGVGLTLSGRHKDGHEFPVEVSLSPVEADGEFLVMSAIRDSTERVRTEEAIRRAKEEAERANSAKSDFLSRMSHELRTPLNAVLGFAQLLEMDPLSPQQEKSVTHILRAGRHLLDLINEVLDIARVESGRLSLSLEPVPVRDVVREALDLVRPLAADRQVEVRTAPGQVADLFVVADRQRLKQVLLNLLSNAVKYNRAGGTVTLEWTQVDAERAWITVRDTGIGIPGDKLDRLFEPFERLGAETTEVEGTGLGLALSRGLVEAMGGRISVTSAIDEGSVFRVELARTHPPSEAEIPRDCDADVAGATSAARLRTVLYIEDNLPNLELIEQILARWSHIRVLPAMHGRLGIELALQHRPDVILLDLHLPDLPGQEVVRLLQADERTRSIPVIVVSADATRGQIERLRAAGTRAYLTKPINVQQFLDVVRDTLERGDA